MITEEQRQAYAEQMKKDKEAAQLEYDRIMLEDGSKDFMDIFPDEFKKKKSGIIRKAVLGSIEKAFEALNKSTVFNGRKFSKVEIVNYILNHSKNYRLSLVFIPRISDMNLFLDFVAKNKPANGSKIDVDKLSDKFEKEKKNEIKEVEELSWVVRSLEQSWELFENRRDVKNGTYDRNMQKNGFPRTGRGNLCYSFIPVKGNYPLEKTDEFHLFNPRTKKDLTYKILAYDLEDEIYKCLNEKGEEVFLERHGNIEEAYSCLHGVNKEIFSGWWNRILISKEK